VRNLLGVLTQLKAIEDQAMALPPEDRERLASHLFQSLSDEESFSLEWEDEIVRRIESIEKGSSKFRPASDVFAEIDEHYA
jgi:putative addiction module component (TIGR02574 family)